MGWTEQEFWRSNPRKLEALYLQYAISQGWYKTKSQVEREKAKQEAEKAKKHNESLDRLKAMARRV